MTIYAHRQENIAAMGGTRTAESMEVSARQWQSEFLNTYLGTEGLRGTLEAGTGAGKTRASIMGMYAWYHMHPDGVVVFYIPAHLMQQTTTVMRSWMLSYARFGGGYKEAVKGKKVYIVSYTSIHTFKAANVIEGRKTMFIMDECHRVAAKQTMKHFDEDFQGDACLMLSATPTRSDGIQPMTILNAPIIYDLPLIDGIRQSRTEEDSLDFTFHVVYVQPEQEEMMWLAEYSEAITVAYHKAYKLCKEDAGGVHWNLFHRNNTSGYYGGGVTHVEWETAEAVMTWQAMCRKRKRFENELQCRRDAVKKIIQENIGKKLAVFSQDIFSVEALNQMVMDEGLFPRIYHSGSKLTPEQALTYPEYNTDEFIERLTNLSRNSKKELNRWVQSSSDILLTCQALQEGFDVPDMDGLIMTSGANSIRSRIQTMGRVFRGLRHKDIWMIVLPAFDGDRVSGDERVLNQLIEKAGIPQENIKYHNANVWNEYYDSIPQEEEEVNPFAGLTPLHSIDNDMEEGTI